MFVAPTQFSLGVTAPGTATDKQGKKTFYWAESYSEDNPAYYCTYTVRLHGNVQ